ncbi:MAG: hypothetical protein ACRD0H_17805 [Actinomycetes bacterium]
MERASWASGDGDLARPSAAPGVVFLPPWRPESLSGVDDHPERFTGHAVVGGRR